MPAEVRIMKRRSILLTVSAMFLLTAALGLPAARAFDGLAAPVRAAAQTPTVYYTIPGPLLVDSLDARLYALVYTAGTGHHIGVFSAKDGRSLASFPYHKPFALDANGNRLFVISGNDQIAVVDARTGKTSRTFPLSIGSATAKLIAAPQYDPKKDQLLVFAGNRMKIVDPKTGAGLDSTGFDVPIQDGCRDRSGDPLPIEQSFFDPDRRLVYMVFNSYSCIPWIGYTIVAYDLDKQAETGRFGAEPFSALATGGGLYVDSWYRFGIGTIWTAKEGKSTYRSTGWSGGSQFQLDTKRSRLLQSSEGSVRVFKRADMSYIAALAQPVKGELAAYDPVSDQVYFVDGATMRPFPAAKLSPSPAKLTKVKAGPKQPVRSIELSPAWQQDKTLFATWASSELDTTCSVFGQVYNSGPLLSSRDGGKQWLQGQSGLPGACGLVSALAVSPAYAKDRTVLAGIRGNGIFKSTDGGTTWQPSGRGLPYMAVQDLALSPGFATDRTAFASLLENGLQRSIDGGASWQSLPTVIAPVIALSPEFDRDGTLALYGMRAGGGALQISQDRGEHWRELTMPSTGGQRLISIAPGFDRWGVMFAGDVTGDLYRSADQGKTWNRVLQIASGEEGLAASAQMQLVYGPAEERREVFLMASGARYENMKQVVTGRLYRSGDGGQTWAEMDAGKGVVPTALAISPSYSQDHTLIIGTADGRLVQIQPPIVQ
jgi:photosystem II stability/assembly factor-like uncharacterized protein